MALMVVKRKKHIDEDVNLEVDVRDYAMVKGAERVMIMVVLEEHVEDVPLSEEMEWKTKLRENVEDGKEWVMIMVVLEEHVEDVPPSEMEF
jgi:hypothetical protein